MKWSSVDIKVYGYVGFYLPTGRFRVEEVSQCAKPLHRGLFAGLHILLQGEVVIGTKYGV